MKVLVIVGPTASGKSALAVRLAKKFDGEIVSADSRQVYTGLDIGTGKITKKEMRGVRHHLLDIISPKKKFSAGDFAKRARTVISDINSRAHLPIVTGGTGFYIDALFGRIKLPDVPPNLSLRKKLAGKTAYQLFALLKKKDPSRATMMDTQSERNNPARLIRALEIAAAPKPATRLNLRSVDYAGRFNLVADHYEVLWIGISPSATVLDTNIRARLSMRIHTHGMIAEARRLHAKGLSYKRMRELGLEYRSLAEYLQKKITNVELEEILYREIRRYARKQTGYWNRNRDIRWFDPKDVKGIELHVSTWL